MQPARIFIVDDDESNLKVLGYILEQAGYEVARMSSAAAVIAQVEKQRPDLVLSDIKMPKMDGMSLLKEIKKRDATIPVVMLTAFGSVDTAVEAMKVGAADYLTKPISRDELTLTVERILRMHRLEQENMALKESLRERFQVDNIVGLSSAMRKVFDVVEQVAATDATVLVTGESGTGKELIAKAVHFNSPRKEHRLVTINCAAIPSELLESELFGHVKGAFTGAVRTKQGKFQLADGGSLFLDEIGSLSLPLQAKLLRALQEKEVERVGDERPATVDVRVIAATNRPLPELIGSGEFREDLYYRLNVVRIEVPPLRDRASDIRLLVGHFTKKYAAERDVAFTDGAVRVLEHYDWPGNVRELENFCERTILMSKENEIRESTVREHIGAMSREQDAMSPVPAATQAGSVSLPEMERQAVLDALVSCDWNQSRAARMLGVPRHVLIYRVKKFGIHRGDR
ncbi:MAG: sigma-54-dependent transcriptional regulator [Candidatus Krumholzibacteriia bacterium]